MMRLHLLRSRGSGAPFHCTKDRQQSADHDVVAKLGSTLLQASIIIGD